MEIRVLRYFLAVAQEENITRAAQVLHITQPSLSKQMMELEQELGKPLLIRGKRHVTLTEEGVLLRKRAEEILALVRRTEQELTTDERQLTGTIAIGGNVQPSLLRAAAALRSRYPGVGFQFYSSDAIDVTERLEHGTLDFTTLLAPVDTARYESTLLPENSRWGLLVRTDDPAAEKPYAQREDILNRPLVMHRRSALQKEIAAWAHTRPERLNIAATYNVIYGSPTELVQSGLGSLLITRDLLDAQLNPAVRFLPLNPPLETQYALVWKKHAVLSRAAEAFLAILQARQTAKGSRGH